MLGAVDRIIGNLLEVNHHFVRIPSGENMRVIVAKPRGFCAGVDRAIEIVEKALDQYGPPIYVRHAIVHNKRVVDTLKDKGVWCSWRSWMKSKTATHV